LPGLEKGPRFCKILVGGFGESGPGGSDAAFEELQKLFGVFGFGRSIGIAALRGNV